MSIYIQQHMHLYISKEKSFQNYMHAGRAETKL